MIKNFLNKYSENIENLLKRLWYGGIKMKKEIKKIALLTGGETAPV